MTDSTAEITLALRPQARFELINVRDLLREQFGSLFRSFRKTVYYSYHTTAGYLDPRVCSRLNHDSESLQAFLETFQKLFPPQANYQHDRMHLRSELSEEQRRAEPKNADAHLTFISSGLSNCVTYQADQEIPVYFIDLDGTNGATCRQRLTTVVGVNRETLAGQTRLDVPVSSHPVDSVNLRDPRLGLFEKLYEKLDHYDLSRGCIKLSLDSEERHAGLTVNEYETLLMKHDLMEVLKNPLRFMAEKGRHIIRDPRAVPTKAKEYAKYDLVQIINEFVDAFGLSESLFERIVDKFLALPAARFLRMKRTATLLVRESQDGRPEIIQGTYQSPILVQWRRSAERRRTLKASFLRFE